MKKIYLVRHCEAQGQAYEAPLTEGGVRQSDVLAEFFNDIHIDQIISSPFLRAIQSIQPLAEQRNLEIETNSLLGERVLSTASLVDWLEKLRLTFDDLDMKLEGGESSLEAMNRIVTVAEDVLSSSDKNVIIVTHGNIMSLLLKYFDENFGFFDWKNLSNPDVFLIKEENNSVTFERIWK